MSSQKIALSAACLLTAFGLCIGSAFAAPSGSTLPPTGLADFGVIRTHETDGSELVWQPRHNLERGWVLTDPNADPNDFDQVYARATVFGDAISELRLGLKYYKGEGVKQDMMAAAKWLRLSAEQGNHTAQAILGFQYYSGAGVPRDLVEAHLWETLALSTLPDGKAHDSVSSLLDSIEREMSDVQRIEAEQRVRDWYAGATSLK